MGLTFVQNRRSLSRMWPSGVVSVDSGALRSSSSSLVATGPVLVLVLVLVPDHITYDASL